MMPLGTVVDLGPGHVVLDGDPAPPERGTAAPSFRPMCIVAKRSPISATAEHLYHIFVRMCQLCASITSSLISITIGSSQPVLFPKPQNLPPKWT